MRLTTVLKIIPTWSVIIEFSTLLTITIPAPVSTVAVIHKVKIDSILVNV